MDAGYHTRIHKISNKSTRRIQYADAGFAIHSHAGPSHSERRFPTIQKAQDGVFGRLETDVSALAVSKAGVSGVIDLLHSGKGKVQDTDGNSNLIATRTVIPLILGSLDTEGTWAATRVYALPMTDGKVGKIGAGWVEEWSSLNENVGLEGLKKQYPFITTDV